MKSIICFLALLLTVLSISLPLYADTLTVNHDGSALYTTIQSAINDAVAGDVVYVYPGIYTEQVVMKDEVNLLGFNPHNTVIDGSNNKPYVVKFNGSSGAVLAGFRIRGSSSGFWNYSGVYVDSGYLMIRNNIIESNWAGIAVSVGAHPQIVNNTIVDNLNGIIFQGGYPALEIPVIIVYEVIPDFPFELAALLDNWGINAVVKRAGDIPDLDMSKHRLIIVMDDAKNWPDDAVDAISKSRMPVLAFGDGGTSLLERLDTGISVENSDLFYDNVVQILDEGDSILLKPFEIDLPSNMQINMFQSGYNEEARLQLMKGLPQDIHYVGVASEAQGYSGFFETSDRRYFLWGYRNAPNDLSTVGEHILINIVRDRITRCYDMPQVELEPLYSKPGISPGKRDYYFRINNWADYPDELFEASPDLPACGGNTSASRTYVEIWNMHQQQIYGYCAISEAAGLALLAVTMDEPGEEFYVSLYDRRCDMRVYSNVVLPRDDPGYPHTIMNNIIVNNSQTGIFYYNFFNEGRILYNDVWNNPTNYFNNKVGGSFAPQPATGEISDDPLFEDLINYHLTDISPCKDTGNPAIAYNDPDDTRNDMGVWGGPDSSGFGYLPGSGFVFTSVGDVPTILVEQSNLPDQGLVTADAAEASDFDIPQYKQAAFGSSLRINGLFGEDDINNGVRWYKILAAKWPDENTPPDDDDYEPIVANLYKTYDDLIMGTTTTVHVGPQSVYGVPDLYLLTYEGIWSHIDRRVIWHTAGLPDGKYTLKCKAYRPHPTMLFALQEYIFTPNPRDHLVLRVNNSGVNVDIHDIYYDPSNPNWDPVSDGEISSCSIISLVDDTENLRLKITAEHSEGFLHYWVLDALYGDNQYAGKIAQEVYPGGLIPPDSWTGVSEIMVDTSSSISLQPWQRCAYQFRLRAYSRITNGYGYLYNGTPPYSDTYSSHFFIEFICSFCGNTDINRDGTVDMLDFALLSANWLNTCSPDCN